MARKEHLGGICAWCQRVGPAMGKNYDERNMYDLHYCISIVSIKKEKH